MDIELPEMRGIEASSIMRSIEKEYEDIHTSIVAVTVQVKGGKNNLFILKRKT